MPTKDEITSEKILIKNVFKMWFCIPEYQRPYVWGDDEIYYLLDDLNYAMKEKPESEFFLGSFVFQVKPAAPEQGQLFLENDLLDGQQRLSTLLMLMAVIRDLSDKNKNKCQEYIYQEADRVENLPERVRLVFTIRKEVERFVHEYVKTEGGTNREDELLKISQQNKDASVKNMANAILKIRSYLNDSGNGMDPDHLLTFLANNVLMIYVATEKLEDAFRLFMILNDRGVPLRNSDILKSINIGELDNDADKLYYAKLWEDAEGELEDEFNRFLNHVRTILVKERPRLTLLKEFEDKIYNPKEIDKVTRQKKPVLLRKGKDTFQLIEKYLSHYKALLGGNNNYDDTGSFEFDNLIRVMLIGLPATDWVPPLLRYYDQFGYKDILPFLKKLDSKFSADWIGQKYPTERIEAMNDVIKVIDKANNPGDVFASDCFNFDKDAFLNIIKGPVYTKRFAKYILLKLDYYFQSHDHKMQLETLSVEHILPQNPLPGSQWLNDFSDEQRAEWTHRLGNLVLITRRKNSAQSNKDYSEKVKSYFGKNIDTCPNSLRILNNYDQWTPVELMHNHDLVINKVKTHYGI